MSVRTIAGHVDLSPQRAAEIPDAERRVAQRTKDTFDDLRLDRLRQLKRDVSEAISSLEVMSEMSAAEPGKRSASAEDDPGGRKPPRSVEHPPRDEDERKDFRVWSHRDAEHFKRRVKRARSISALEAILKDLQETIKARRRAPTPTAPTLSDPLWKRFVGESREKTSDLARRYGVTEQYINRVRAQYRERKAA